jgi:hypothetical protein
MSATGDGLAGGRFHGRGALLTYAVNTGFAGIGAGGRYYVCYQGAWFVGATPQGPWILAETVPAVIYTIPPTSPVYYVTYVKVYGASPATVTFGYISGYTTLRQRRGRPLRHRL